MLSNPRGKNHRILSNVLTDALDRSATLALYEKNTNKIYS